MNPTSTPEKLTGKYIIHTFNPYNSETGKKVYRRTPCIDYTDYFTLSLYRPEIAAVFAAGATRIEIDQRNVPNPGFETYELEKSK